jgi:hypothetical protein
MSVDQDSNAREPDLFSLAEPWLPVLWLPFCLTFVGIFVYIVVERVTYPYPLEWLEPDTPDVVSRIFAGLPLYCEPTYAYVPSMKTPLYYYAVALFSIVIGKGLIAGRIVSVLSTLGVCSVIWHFLRRETGTYTWAVLGVGLFLATYRISQDWYDVGRLDAFFLLFTLAGAYTLRFSHATGGAVAAGILFAAAYFTKQAVLLFATPTLILTAFTETIKATVAGLTFLIIVVAGMAAFHFFSDGWSTFFLVEVPRHIEIDWSRLSWFWTSDMFLLPLALLTSAGFLVAIRTSDRGKALFYAGLFGGALLTGLLGRMNIAGSLNVLMLIYAVIAVMMPQGLQHAAMIKFSNERLRRVSRIAVHVLAFLQLGFLLYDPRQSIPSPNDEERSRQIFAYLSSIDGKILIMDDRFFANFLSKSSTGLDYSMIDLLQDNASPVTEKFRQSVIYALHARQFVGVVDPPNFVVSSVTLAPPVIIHPESLNFHRNLFAPRMERFYGIRE